MPTEFRILCSNHNETLEILREYCDQAGRVRPDISHIRLPMVQDGRVKVVLRLGGVSETLEFTESELGAAIIMYCTKHGIPMAHHAIKSLEIAHSTLLLHLRL